jgi:hypothetical protein
MRNWTLFLILALATWGCTQLPSPVCGLPVVSYLFIGSPGQRFTFNDEQIVIPHTGYIELLARGDDCAVVYNRPVVLAAFAVDGSGRVTVDITPVKISTRGAS